VTNRVWTIVSGWLFKVSRDRVVKNSAYSTIGFILPVFTMLFFTPQLVRRMGHEGYGLWHVAISSLGLMGSLELGLGAAVAKYIAEYNSSQDTDGLSSVTTIGFVLSLIVGVVLTLPLYQLAPQIAHLFHASNIASDQVEEAIKLASLGFIPLLLKNNGLAVPRGLQRFGILTAMQLGQNVLTVVVAFIVTLLSDSIEWVVLSTILLMWLFSLGSLVIAFRMLRTLNVRFLFSSAYLRRMFSFMTFAGLDGIGRQVFSSMDRLAVGVVLGLSDVAYYTVAIGIANKFIALASALTEALMPAASVWYATGNMQRLWKYFRRSTAGLVLLNLGLGGALLVLSGPFLRFWMGEDFARPALVPFRILILVYAVMSLTAPAYQIANGIGVPWINTLGALGSGLGTILFIIILGRTVGLEGAAWANAASWSKFLVPVYVSYRIRGKLGPKGVES
jgi:O-antigen/teichoic acid export membrane protein